jgi:biofilm PGA synthesis N-glycosyltransferase PgaC
LLIEAWLILCFLLFGVPALIFILMRKASSKHWEIKIDEKYRPKVSIIVPTYNESDLISFKLKNLARIEYPDDLMEIIIVDGKSSDNTIVVVNDFVIDRPNLNVKVLVEKERKGKSSALNLALENCTGDVVIVSDADCFWPPDILYKSLPFLADPRVGAISGPKILLNPKQSWVTKTEDAYLNSMNLMKLGESKIGSTLMFEGGFSAYKREVLDSFDPYNTGSDDCGTIVTLAEKNFRAIFIPEAWFYSAFPRTWKGKLSVKIRRANQLMRVFLRYISLLLGKRISGSKRIILQGIFIYVLSPVMFIVFLGSTVFLLLSFPYFAIIFLAFLIPKAGSYLLEVVQNYFVLFFSMFAVAFKKRFAFWNKPEDRVLLREDMLRQHGLI